MEDQSIKKKVLFFSLNSIKYSAINFLPVCEMAATHSGAHASYSVSANYKTKLFTVTTPSSVSIYIYCVSLAMFTVVLMRMSSHANW
jgi:hypothetical protein